MLIDKDLGIYRVRLSLPFRLNHINSYAFEGSEGWTIVDTGLNTEQSRQTWLQFMAEHGITGRDIKAIYITHSHPDHFGAAGWLQSISEAPVLISAIDGLSLQNIWQIDNLVTVRTIADMFNADGMPPSQTAAVTAEVGNLAVHTRPFPVFHFVEPGSKVQLGDFQYRVIFTPGHSDGHICFLNEDFGVLLSGDHLLPIISSNISLWPAGEPDPLGSYLRSLQDNLRLPLRLVLPAHGSPFSNVEERIKQLLAHHEERLQRMKELAAGGASAYTICSIVFGRELSNHEMRFAMTETAAHLRYMVYRGELKVAEHDGIRFYS
jgi:glyoxylase-like metal-dependent hydrolase (beta-lactamase superfamily II)